jgi:hypothetical protein
MVPELLRALLGIAAILGLWLAVQRWFRRASGLAADADSLAGHVRCHGCTCDTSCANRAPAPNPNPTR